MALYLGKKKITPIKVVDLPDDLDKELTKNEKLADEIQATINGLKDISDETLNINENGEYNVKDYGRVSVSVGVDDLNYINIKIPAELAAVSNQEIYYCVVNEDEIVFSVNIKNVQTGIWLYTKSTDTTIQLISYGSIWINYKKIDNERCFIGGGRSGNSSSDSNGILIYNSKTKSIEVLYDKSFEWRYFIEINGGFLISKDHGLDNTPSLFYYNKSTNELFDILYGGYDYSVVFNVGDGKYLVTNNGKTGTATEGVLLFNSNTKEIKQLDNSIKGLSSSFQISDTKYLCFGYYSGLYIFDGEIEMISLIDATMKSSYYKAFTLNNKTFVYSTSSSKVGLWTYNVEENLIEQIYSQGYDFTIYPISENSADCLLCAFNLGIIKYSEDTNSITLENLEIGHGGWSKVYENTENGIWVFTATSYGDYGAIMYSKSLDTLTKIIETGYGWVHIFDCGNNLILISSKESSKSNGVWLLNMSNTTSTKIYTSGNNWGNFYKVSDNKVLITSQTYTSNTYAGILLAKPLETICTQLVSRFFYDTFEPTDNKVEIYHSNKKYGVRKQLYNPADDSVVLIGLSIQGG